MAKNTLLDDLGDDDLVATGLGRHFSEDFGIVSRAVLIAFAPDVEDLVGVCHWLDAFDIDGVQLIEIAEDVVKLAAELGFFFVSEFDAREIRYVVDVNMWFLGHGYLRI